MLSQSFSLTILLKYCNVGCKDSNIIGKMSTFAVCFNSYYEIV